jgi:hypothetical protein
LEIPLFVCGAVAELADVVDDVSVRYGQIEIRIIVVVQESDAEADEWQGGLAHAAFKRHVAKAASTMSGVHPAWIRVEEGQRRKNRDQSSCWWRETLSTAED